MAKAAKTDEALGDWSEEEFREFAPACLATDDDPVTYELSDCRPAGPGSNARQGRVPIRG